MPRVYYDGGKIYDGDDPPARGVLAILQENPYVGVEIVTSADYYVLEDGRWRGVDIFGLFDYLIDSGIVLFGRMVSKEEYNEIMTQVSEDKHGWLAEEERFKD